MSVKILVSEPIIAKMGIEYSKNEWGLDQFPCIRRLPNGFIGMEYHFTDDSAEAYGREKAVLVSEDDGNSWREVNGADEEAYVRGFLGKILPSGKTIRTVMDKPVKVSEEKYAELKKLADRNFGSLPMEAVSDLMPKTYAFLLGDPVTGKVERMECELDFPGMTTWLCSGAVVKPFVFCDIKVAPDGSLWFCTYAKGRNPKNLGYQRYDCVYFLRSTDEGKTLKLHSWIQFKPDTEIYPDMFKAEGFNESDIAFMPDGSVIAVFRSGFTCPSFISRSTDGGKTWSEPEVFDKCGVFPNLLQLKCGVTLASYGRPGLFVRATDHPSGTEWSEPVTIIEPERNLGMPFAWNSCYYTSMVELGDDEALLVNSDFRVKDERGVERKSLCVRRIKVVKE